jgi:putative toxin-antitoxin system antitoxin component (TIGR02293 family)
VADRYELDLNYLSTLLGASKRTLARRAQRGEPLSPVESDRLIRFLRIAAHAEEVFESREKAIAWLKADNRALGGQAPMDLLDTDAGTEQVDEVLTRIDYGVYS